MSQRKSPAAKSSPGSRSLPRRAQGQSLRRRGAEPEPFFGGAWPKRDPSEPEHVGTPCQDKAWPGAGNPGPEAGTTSEGQQGKRGAGHGEAQRGESGGSKLRAACLEQRRFAQRLSRRGSRKRHMLGAPPKAAKPRPKRAAPPGPRGPGCSSL